ncbi:MAG: hypothetical protein QM783_00070 [Phycisphaerales bacterium]
MATPPPVNQPFGSPSPKKSSTGLYVGIGAALLVGVLFVLGVVIAGVSVANKRARNKEAIAQFQKEADSLKGTIKPDDDLTDPETAKKADQVIERVSNAAGNLDQRMKALVKTMMEEMVAIGKDASAISNRVTDAGGIDPFTLKTKEAAVQRVELLQKEQRNAQANLMRTKNLSLTARAAAVKNGLTSEEVDSFIRGMNGKGQVERLTRIREIDTLLFQSFINYVTILRDNHGSWRIEHDGVTFSNAPADVVDRFNALIKEIADLSQEQTDLVDQLSKNK